ncbi:MAG: sensor histidine kinase [Gammaproteobacteria bacterium]
MPSLQKQLRRNMLITLSLMLAAMLVLVDAGVRKLTFDYVASRLQHDAESIIAALEQSTEGAWQVDTTRLPAVYQRVKSGHYYQVAGDNTRLRSRSLWDEAPPLSDLASGASHTALTPGMEQEQWLTWTQAITLEDERLLVWVAEDISALQQTHYQYSLWAGAVVLLVILALMLAQHWILKKGFRQLDSVRDAIKALHAGDLGAFGQTMPQEVQPLLQEIDRLLQRLQQKVSRSRNALGNLAHEMKRPLQQLRLLGNDLPADNSRELLQTLNDITQLVERELKRARIVGVSSPGRQTVIREELPVLVELLQKIYPHCTLRTDYRADLVLPQDRDDMLELLGNLLDNACKYGNGIVMVSLTELPDGWRIQVEDNGPGIPDTSREQILQRGVRLDESKAGSGLGLAICHDIVRSYEGTLAFESLEDSQGFRVTVELPILTPD